LTAGAGASVGVSAGCRLGGRRPRQPLAGSDC